MEHLITLLKRPHRVVLGTQMEHLEHVPEGIPDNFTVQTVIFNQSFRILERILRDRENLLIPIDSAHRVLILELAGAAGTALGPNLG
ncbi:unnamed protein product [Rotaria sp. Silwood1]|nr:unnamed protein product [Rotaria sp. Silwood1]